MFGPYEPLVMAQPKEYTLKTAFLLALAAGSRRSEVNAWSIDNVKQIGQWSEVILGASPDFLAKNQSERALASVFTPVVIKSLSKTLDKHDRALDKDRSLCPVRALRIYLDNTKDIRKGRKKLFIAHKIGHTGEICAATISSWLRTLVKESHYHMSAQTGTLLEVKVHQVRKMAASWALMGGASVDSILTACHWKNHNTFSQFYLQDITWMQGDFMTLEPFVTAQQVVDLSEKPNRY